MGAGDVKLMAAIGAWLAPVAVIHAALYTAMAGAVLALTVACAHGCLRQTYTNLQLLVLHWRVAGFASHADLTLQTATSPRLAYAIPVFVGTVIATWLS
jgi:prepilin peptidase CpaA